MWGSALEVVGILAMIVSFTLLGRTLGPEGFGGYASLYAVIGPLVTLAASGVTLALLEHAIRNRESLAATARSCMSLSLVLGALLFCVGGLIASFVVESLTTVAIVTILLTEFITTPLIQIAAGTVQAGSGYTGAAQIRIALVTLRLVALILLYAIGALSVATLGSVHLFSTAVLAIVVLRRMGRDFGFSFLPGRVNLHHLRTNFVYSSGISAFAASRTTVTRSCWRRRGSPWTPGCTLPPTGSCCWEWCRSRRSPRSHIENSSKEETAAAALICGSP